MLEVVCYDAVTPLVEQCTNNEVIWFTQQLDIGPLQNPLSLSLRSEYLMMLSMDTLEQEEQTQLLEKQQYGYQRFLKAIENKEDIRIWRGRTVHSECALAYLASLLQQSGYSCWMIELPAYFIRNDGNMIEYQDFYECCDLTPLIKLTRFIQPIELQHFSMQWDTLLASQYQLRALINHQLLAVPDDFYDQLLLSYAQTASSISNIIGNFLGLSQLAVSEVWCSYRLFHLIDRQRLQVISTHENRYQWVVQSL